MLLAAQFEKCILCSERHPNSREHVIPKCLGGTLQSLILCSICNSQFGADFVGQVKRDPSIRMAVHYLRDEIPELAAQFEEGLEFCAEGKDGIAVAASTKRGTWKTKAKQTNESGLVIDTADAPLYIRNTLERRGLSESEVASWINRFAFCDNGQQLQLPSGDTLSKNQAIVNLPKLTGRFLDDRVPALIAYEFLALCIGNSIVGPNFDDVRKFIRFGTRTEQLEVLSKTTRNYGPWHTVRLNVKDGNVTVVVQFFRWLVFEVSIRGTPAPSKEVIYVEDLQNRQRLIALSSQDARQGNWTVL